MQYGLGLPPLETVMFALENLFARTDLARAMRDNPVTCVDIGARNGADANLLPIAFAADVIGFEPEADAFAGLSPQSLYRSVRYENKAIGWSAGKRPLRVTRDPQSSTLLEPDERIGAEFGKPQFFETVKTVEVETATLDDALAAARVGGVDFLKLDIEGAEYEVLQASPRALASAVAVKTEVSFVPFRKNQKLAADMERYMAENGFRLMDLMGPSRWRRHGYVIHPHFAPEPIPYSRGQIMHGDYLFMRDPATLVETKRAARAAFIAMAYGYFDYAEVLLTRNDVADELRQRHGIDVGAAVRAASALYGRVVLGREIWAHMRAAIPLLRSLARMVFRPLR